MGELNKAQAAAEAKSNDAAATSAADAAKGEGTESQKLISNRIGRLGKRVKSAKAIMNPTGPLPGNPVKPGTPGTLSGNTGQVIPEKPVYLKPHAMNIMNSSPEMSAMIPNIGVYRHSYGPMLDSVYGMFRDRFLKPTPPQPIARMTRSDMINNPDMIGSLSRVYNGILRQNA